jgi:hypothetical protein
MATNEAKRIDCAVNEVVEMLPGLVDRLRDGLYIAGQGQCLVPLLGPWKSQVGGLVDLESAKPLWAWRDDGQPGRRNPALLRDCFGDYLPFSGS